MPTDTSRGHGAAAPAQADARPSLAELALDESRRPSAPRIEDATTAHRRQGRRLALIHRMHLQELGQVRLLMERIEAGEEDPARLAEAVPALDMTRNFRAFGTLCGQACQILTFHHTAEDRQIFPILAAEGSDGLRAVVARLQEEHHIVHTLLDRLMEDARALMTDPGEDTFAEAQATFRALEKTVRSHFGYEETELEEALGYHDAF